MNQEEFEDFIEEHPEIKESVIEYGRTLFGAKAVAA